jgi:Flp pilus assembly protein protease CpaA
VSTQDFFPNAPFAWVFCFSVIALTAVAAVIDTKTAKIPNRLTVLILFAGVAFTLVRSVWQAAVDHPLFAFDTGSPLLGGLDGVLFALLGFLLAFGLYFAFWIFGLAGGGDVKLMAALGAWFGVSGFIYLWVTSIFTLLLWTGFVILYAKATGKKNFGGPKTAPVKKGGKPVPQRRGLQVTYAVPVAAATLLASLWMYRVDLQLMPPKPAPADQTGGTPDAPLKPN